MGTWKDKVRKDWRYAFQCCGKVYAGGGFKTKLEARQARVEKQSLMKKVLKESGNPSRVVDLPAFKSKYRSMYDSGIAIGTIFNSLMEELDIPVEFRDLREIFVKKRERKIQNALRTKILARDGFKCQWCGRSAPDVILHVDHINPVANGGLTEERNLRTLCSDCNNGKSDRHFLVPVSR